jgi:hypothetical protein
MGSLLSELHTVLQHKRKCNFIYTHKNGTLFPARMFSQLAVFNSTVSRYHYSECHSDKTKDVDSLARSSLNARK